MVRTARLTISLPEELVAFADEIARKNRTSRSKVISACLRKTVDELRAVAMVEGYQAMAGEQKDYAAIASKIEHEVIPEWR